MSNRTTKTTSSRDVNDVLNNGGLERAVEASCNDQIELNRQAEAIRYRQTKD